MFDLFFTFLKDVVYFYVNYVLNMVPSRKFRAINYYMLSGGNISLRASIGIGTRILDVRNVIIHERANINGGCILDGRGASLTIESDVDISPRVMIWTLEHDPRSESFESRSGAVVIRHHAWLASGVIVLPKSEILSGAVISAGTVVKGLVEERVLLSSSLERRLRDCNCQYELRALRRFR